MNSAYIVIGLGYGDEGKGTITDALTRQFNSKLTVRFNGGAQAAHCVITPEGKRHIFSQFGSGTLAGASTLLSRYMLVNPLAMMNEAEFLRQAGVPDAMSRVYIDERALITTPFHIALNRLREMSRGVNLHGSCGMGIGETVAHALAHPSDAICAKDLLSPDLAGKLVKLRGQLFAEAQELKSTIVVTDAVKDAFWQFALLMEDIVIRYVDFAKRVQILTPERVGALLDSHENIVFEGAQGVLLDEEFGFSPYTTWSKTTAINARHIIHEFNLSCRPTIIGVTRTYSTRHGPGPFVPEDSRLPYVDNNNPTNPWQKHFRVGDLDLVALEYAVACQPIDCVALTHLDAINTRQFINVVTRYIDWEDKSTYRLLSTNCTERLLRSGPMEEQVTPHQLPAVLVQRLRAPIRITSNGPTFANKQWSI